MAAPQLNKAVALMLALSIIPFFVPLASADTYLVEFGGESYTEDSDIFARFSHFTVEDPDGDDLVDVPPLNYTDITVSWGSGDLSRITNAAIDTLVIKFETSETNIVSQFNLMMLHNSTWDDERLAAIDFVNAGEYKEASNVLQGTVAALNVYCNGRVYDWVVAIPLPVNCYDNAGELTTQDELEFISEVTSVRTSGTRLIGFDAIAKTQGTGLGGTNHQVVFGVGYQPVDGVVGGDVGNEISAGIKSFWGALGNRMDADLTFDGLTTNNRRGTASIFKDFSVWDRIHVSFGPLIDSTSKKVTGELGSNQPNQIDVEWSFVQKSNGWDVVVYLGQGYYDIDKIKLRYPFGLSSCHRVAVGAVEFPNWFRVGYRKSDLADHLGDKHYIKIGREASTASIYDMEVKATYYKSCKAEASVQFKGFPGKTSLRLDMGGSSTNKVYSIDLTKVSGYEGYFRTIVGETYLLGKRTKITFADVTRVNVVFGPNDKWDSDRDPFGEAGVNFAKCKADVSRATLNFYDVPIIGEAKLMYRPLTGCGVDPDTYTYEVIIDSITGCPSPIDGCDISEGSVRKDPDTYWFNAWWWAIPDGSIGNQSTCFKLEEDKCP